MLSRFFLFSCFLHSFDSFDFAQEMITLAGLHSVMLRKLFFSYVCFLAINPFFPNNWVHVKFNTLLFSSSVMNFRTQTLANNLYVGRPGGKVARSRCCSLGMGRWRQLGGWTFPRPCARGLIFLLSLFTVNFQRCKIMTSFLFRA